MFNAASTIANATGGFPRRASSRNPRTTLDYRVPLPLYSIAVGHAGDYLNLVARGTTRRPCRLDFLAARVYPEACHSMPQVDRDAVFVFLGD